MTVRATLVVALSALVFPASAIVAAQPAQEPIAKATPHLVDSEEFPQSDGMIAVLQEKGERPAYIRSRLAEGRPGLDLVGLAFQGDHLDTAVRLLRAYLDARPDADDQTLDLIWQHVGRFQTKSPEFKTRNLHLQYRQVLRCVDIIRRRQDRQPRELAARVAWQLLYVDDAIVDASKPRIDSARRDAFISRWAGTDAAQVADIERRLSPPVTSAALDAMEEFARAHPGTDVGARAWAELAIVLRSGEIAIDGVPAHGFDPTERYLRLITVADALQAAHAPSNVWVQRAPGLVGGFVVLQPKFGPAGPGRLLAAYRDFMIRQLSRPGASAFELGGVAFGTSHTLPTLLSDSGVDAQPAMEAWFDEVEHAVTDKSVVRFLRAGFYEYWAGIGSDAPRPAVEQKARATLLALAAEPPGTYPRRALAHLAARLFANGEYALARTQFLTDVERYPSGDWAWVAAVRAGQCSERLQEWPRAIDEYRHAATQYSSNPLARVLGLTYAARVSEKAGARTRALTEYRAARRAWSSAYGASYTVGDPFSPRDPWKVTRGGLERRIAKLKS